MASWMSRRLPNFLARIHERLVSAQGVSQRAIAGVAWVVLLRTVDRSIQILRIIVVARILAPRDFGLLGVALFTMAAFEALSQTGFEAALIQKNRDIGPYLDTAWIIQASRGLLLALAVGLAAPRIAVFFGQTDAIPVMQVAAASLALRGLASIGVVCMTKELQFREISIASLWASLVNFAVTTFAALITRNVWALVFGLLGGELTRTLTTYFLHPYRPGVRFETSKAVELYRFGRWVFARNLIGFLNNHIDDAVVAKLLGAGSLGLYQIAYRVSTAPLEEVHTAVGQVLFPAYSKLQARLLRLRRAYLEVLQVNLSISAFAAAGVLALGPELILLLLGEKWLPAVPALRVLAATTFFMALTPTVGPLLRSLGRPDVNAKIALLRLGVLISVIYPLSATYGIAGTAWAVLLSVAVVVPLHHVAAARALEIPVSEIWRLILPSLTTSFAAVSALLGVKSIMTSTDSNYASTALLCVLFSLMYLGGLLLWRTATCRYNNPLDIMSRRIGRFLENGDGPRRADNQDGD